MYEQANYSHVFGKIGRKALLIEYTLSLDAKTRLKQLFDKGAINKG
jgi:hypothetical protein